MDERIRIETEKYKNEFLNRWGKQRPLWVAVKHFQNSWDIDADNFSEMFAKATEQADAYLNRNGYKPRAFIIKLALKRPDEVRDLFRKLYDESVPIEIRCRDFKQEIKRIKSVVNNKIDYQNMPAVSTYLWLRYPEKYCIFKRDLYDKVAEQIGKSVLPINEKEELWAMDFWSIFKDFEESLSGDKDFRKALKSKLDDSCYSDDNCAVAALDICFMIRPLWAGSRENVEENIHEVKDNKTEEGKTAIMQSRNMEFPKNMILYGPPGTGKTYNSVNYAVSICEGKSLEDVQKEDYTKVLERFEALKKSGRIAFTTFHQSYGYEEFIEGIKPITDVETGNISYEVKNGVFKDFCEKAEIPQNAEVNHVAQIYIVRLKGNGENDLKKECFRDGEIRFDWPADYTDGWMKWLVSMKPGDYVMSYYGQSKYVDAIGVVRDEEPVYDGNRKSYRWIRKVEWLVTDRVIDILEANNGKYLSNFHVGRVPDMKISALLKLVGDNAINDDEDGTEPCAFIIDEINRGNISKIFGELITLIEDSKRKGSAEEMSVVLPYSNAEFSVPSNVFIIGTMNTADRSIALMDTALRRRFSFVEMMPSSNVLKNLGIEKIKEGDIVLNVADMLDVINKRIECLYDREHTIGHAFFIKLKDSHDINTLAEIFETNVIPLLQEYFYEDYAKIQYVLGDNQKADSLKFILDASNEIREIFSGAPDIDIPEKKYSIQKEAFFNIESYKSIGKGL